MADEHHKVVGLVRWRHEAVASQVGQRGLIVAVADEYLVPRPPRRARAELDRGPVKHLEPDTRGRSESHALVRGVEHGPTLASRAISSKSGRLPKRDVVIGAQSVVRQSGKRSRSNAPNPDHAVRRGQWKTAAIGRVLTLGKPSVQAVLTLVWGTFARWLARSIKGTNPESRKASPLGPS